MSRPLLRLTLTAASLLALASPAAAQDTGPALSVPADRLAQSLRCPVPIEGAARAPVLLVPGTGENPDFFDWNYARAFTLGKVPFCTVTLPGFTTDDIQTAAEYVVHAIRQVRARSGRRIAIIGHSQGGMSPRWALKYWPDTRAMVDDLIGLASSNHGTEGARLVCNPNCTAATHQQKNDSRFITALNTGPETFAGISYTSVFTRFDEVVTPNQDEATGSTALRTGDGRRANVATQSVCPNNTSEHLVLGSSDAVGHALAVDALEHDGPADPSRIAPAVCAQPFQPGVNPATFAADSSTAYAKVLQQFSTGSPQIPAEPPLRCYVTATCAAEGTGAGASGGQGAARPCRSRRAFTIRLPAPRGDRLVSARVTVNGRKARVLRGKRLRAAVVLRGLPRGTYRVRIVGRTRKGRTLRATRTYRTCVRRVVSSG